MQKLIQWLGPILLNFLWTKGSILVLAIIDWFTLKWNKKKVLDAGNEEVKKIDAIVEDGKVTDEELKKLEEATRNLINNNTPK